MRELFDASALSDATTYINTSGHGRELLRSLVHHWSWIAERQLTKVFQIPDERQEAFWRHKEGFSHEVPPLHEVT